MYTLMVNLKLRLFLIKKHELKNILNYRLIRRKKIFLKTTDIQSDKKYFEPKLEGYRNISNLI